MRTAVLPRVARVAIPCILVVGCAAAAPSSARPSQTTAPAMRSTTPAPSGIPGAGSGPNDPPPNALLVVGRAGSPGLQLIEAASGDLDMDLPAGAPRDGWTRIATATADGAATIVRDVVVQPGFGGPELRLPGHWHLPTVGLDPTLVGLSIDGSTIALVEDAAGISKGRSRFAIVEHYGGVVGGVVEAGTSDLQLARIVDLPGIFDYDALSPDGRILYVVEHLDAAAGGHYQVRAVDVTTGVLRDGVVVDKGNPDEQMAGVPLAQLRRPGGLVLTLYAGPEHAFIHALNSAEAWAICIDLPTSAGGVDKIGRAWDLAASPDGSTVYAANALGLVVEVDPAQFAVRRSATVTTTAAAPITTTAAAPIELAKFGHSDIGPVGRGIAVSLDGSLLFVPAVDGVTVIRTRDLVAVRHDLAGWRVDALGLTPDGTMLFAMTRGLGSIVAVDAATGQQLGRVPGSGYDRLVAVALW